MDFGSEATVPHTNLRQLPAALADVPAQAFPAHLAGVKPDSSEATVRLLELSDAANLRIGGTKACVVENSDWHPRDGDFCHCQDRGWIEA